MPIQKSPPDLALIFNAQHFTAQALMDYADDLDLLRQLYQQKGTTNLLDTVITFPCFSRFKKNYLEQLLAMNYQASEQTLHLFLDGDDYFNYLAMSNYLDLFYQLIQAGGYINNAADCLKVLLLNITNVNDAIDAIYSPEELPETIQQSVLLLKAAIGSHAADIDLASFSDLAKPGYMLTTSLAKWREFCDFTKQIVQAQRNFSLLVRYNFFYQNQEQASLPNELICAIAEQLNF
jgi:hypothetical protein